MARFLALCLAILLAGCKPPVQEVQEVQEDPYREQFVKTNQYMQRRHQDQIEAFLERVAWEAKQTSTGLWIVHDTIGAGPEIRDGDFVSFSFSAQLLDGTPAYESTPKNPKQIIIGKSDIESGVTEGLMLMKNGGRAILLIPPHLAHGNFGDRDKIPGNSVLIYKIEVLDVRPGS